MKIKIIMIMASAILTGCAASSVKVASEAEDREAKKFITYPSKATVYLYRDNTVKPNKAYSPFAYPVWVDGKSMGEMGIHSYYHLILEPGEHVFASEANDLEETIIETKAGEVTFVQIDVEYDYIMRPIVSVYKADTDRSIQYMNDYVLIKYVGEESNKD